MLDVEGYQCCKRNYSGRRVKPYLSLDTPWWESITKRIVARRTEHHSEVLSIRRATARTSMDIQFMSITRVPARTMHGYAVIWH